MIGSGGPPSQRSITIQAPSFEIFPNPGKNKFTITLKGESKESFIKEVVVKNTLGVTVFTQKFNTKLQKQNINIPNQKTDVYIVDIFDSKRWILQKLVIQN